MRGSASLVNLQKGLRKGFSKLHFLTKERVFFLKRFQGLFMLPKALKGPGHSKGPDLKKLARRPNSQKSARKPTSRKRLGPRPNLPEDTSHGKSQGQTGPKSQKVKVRKSGINPLSRKNLINFKVGKL